MKYLIVESHTSYCIALDQQGRFLRVANMGYEEGQYVDNVITINENKKAVTAKRVILSVSAAAACLLLIVAAVFNRPLPSSYAAIYLAINPQLRMDIAQDGQVLGISALNDDGQLLMDDYAYSGKKYAEVIDALLLKAMEMSYLTDDATITIDIDAPDDSWFEDTGVALRTGIEDLLAGRVDARLKIRRFGENDTPVIRPATPPPAASSQPIATAGDDDDTGRQAPPPATARPAPIPQPVKTASPSTPQPQDDDDDGDDDDDVGDDDDD